VEATQLGSYLGHQPIHSSSGWTTTAPFLHDLHRLRSQYQDAALIDLVLDFQSVHCCETSKACTLRMCIMLHFIPAEWTDELRPLDRDIFGTLKAICRRLLDPHCHAAQDASVVKANIARFLLEAWDVLELRVFEKGLAVSEDEVGDRADGGEGEDYR
jgi:hypothetical protein